MKYWAQSGRPSTAHRAYVTSWIPCYAMKCCTSTTAIFTALVVVLGGRDLV